MKSAFSLVAVSAAMVGLAACGSGGAVGSGRPMEGHRIGMTSSPATADHNSQDVMFAQMMIPHHQQAIDMAGQAATRASSPEVKRLALQIKNAQQPEIQKMTGWLKDWGEPTRPPSGMHMAEGMASAQEMKKLGTLSGQAFDTMFLRMMIKHHRGAVTMARTEQEQGASPDAKTLAGSIVASQSAEIATMQKLLKNK